MTLESLLTNRITERIAKWDQHDIYAISLLVTYDELSVFHGVENFSEVSVGYNTEDACGHAPLLSEERWNYACWEQNNEVILDSTDTVGADMYLKWCAEQGISDIGNESEDEMYDDDMNYIGKGPNGIFELVDLLSRIALNLRSTDIFKEAYGNIPIIIHDLDYSWYTVNATKKANPNGEADSFLEYSEMSF